MIIAPGMRLANKVFFQGAKMGCKGARQFMLLLTYCLAAAIHGLEMETVKDSGCLQVTFKVRPLCILGTVERLITRCTMIVDELIKHLVLLSMG